jgi:hypothetical protein
VVDRVVETVAVVESPDRTIIDLPLLVLPPAVREGDRLMLCIVPLPTSPVREARLRVKDERSSTPVQSRSTRVH